MPEMMVDGTRVHFLRSKAKRTPRAWPIVFVHGSGGNAGLWARVMDGLADDYTSLAVDLPGHGSSAGEGRKSIEEYSHFLGDFLRALGLKAVILGGHSMGGAIVLDLALRDPQGLKALLLVGTGARLRVLPEVLERQRQMAEGQVEPKFYPWGFSEKASPEVLAEGEREWAKTNSRTRYHDLLACDRFDIIGEVEKIRLPSLIVCGSEDPLTPVKYSEFLTKRIAGAKMELIEGAGHTVMLETPQILSQKISNFLALLDS